MTKPDDSPPFPLEAYLELLTLEPDQVPPSRRPEIYRELACRDQDALSPREALWAQAVLEANRVEIEQTLHAAELLKIEALLAVSGAMPTGRPQAPSAPISVPQNPQFSYSRMLGVTLGALTLLGLPLAVLDHFQLYEWPTERSMRDLHWQAGFLCETSEGRPKARACLENALVHIRLAGLPPRHAANIHRALAGLALMPPGPRFSFREHGAEPEAHLVQGYDHVFDPSGYQEAVHHLENAIRAGQTEERDAQDLSRNFAALIRVHQVLGDEARARAVEDRVFAEAQDGDYDPGTRADLFTLLLRPADQVQRLADLPWKICRLRFDAFRGEERAYSWYWVAQDFERAVRYTDPPQHWSTQSAVPELGKAQTRPFPWAEQNLTHPTTVYKPATPLPNGARELAQELLQTLEDIGRPNSRFDSVTFALVGMAHVLRKNDPLLSEQMLRRIIAVERDIVTTERADIGQRTTRNYIVSVADLIALLRYRPTEIEALLVGEQEFLQDLVAPQQDLVAPKKEASQWLLWALRGIQDLRSRQDG